MGQCDGSGDLIIVPTRDRENELAMLKQHLELSRYDLVGAAACAEHSWCRCDMCYCADYRAQCPRDEEEISALRTHLFSTLHISRLFRPVPHHGERMTPWVYCVGAVGHVSS